MTSNPTSSARGRILNYEPATPRATRWRVRWGWIAAGFAMLIGFGAMLRAGARDYGVAVRAVPQQHYANVHIITFTKGRIGVATFGPGVVDVATGRPLRVTNVTVIVQPHVARSPASQCFAPPVR